MAARCGRKGTSLSFSGKMAGFSPNALFSVERLGYPIKPTPRNARRQRFRGWGYIIVPPI